MAGHFRSYVWDPTLIMLQIITVQSVFYGGLGLWIFIIDFFADESRSLDQIFSYELLDFRSSRGRLMMAAYVLNALTGALGLLFIVGRAKQCVDFTATAHLFNFIGCWIYNQHFPTSLVWWLLNIVCIALMAVIGEFLCMRKEMQAIPVSIGQKVDL
ncbi:protein SYS1 homolog [Branchiostoma floridae x Branchiostoma belcheri]